MKAFVNGQENDAISIFDRGLLYGDGLFETIRVAQYKIPLLNEHLFRLEMSCQRLNISAVDFEELKQELNAVAQIHSSAIIKLTITRGLAQKRGYAPSIQAQPTRIIVIEEYEPYSLGSSNKGVRATVCDMRLSQNKLLAGLKHLNKLEYVLASDEVARKGYEEGILLDVAGHVIECTKANLFFVKNNCLYTPDLSKSGVAGVMRAKLIGLAKEQLSLRVEIADYSLSDVLDADEIFVCNSIIGIRAITSVDKASFGIGDISIKLTNSVEEIFT